MGSSYLSSSASSEVSRPSRRASPFVHRHEGFFVGVSTHVAERHSETPTAHESQRSRDRRTPIGSRPSSLTPATAGAGDALTGAQALVRSLEEVGATVVFGIPGGAILPAYDPLFDSTKVRHILVRHEQGAGHAAEGYAQATGKVGVCMATSGPGATNLVTPIADAYMDSVPIVAITGQVGRADDRHRRLPGGRHLRHHAADHQAQLPGAATPRTIPQAIAEAFHLAATGRPGPVLVDLPKDVLQEQTSFDWPPQLDLPGYRPGDPAARQAGPRGGPADRGGPAAGALRRRRRDQGPGDRPSCAELAELTGIPVVTTLMARGAFPDSHPQHLGMPGMHGTVAAVTALQKADLLIALGARFDDRVTGQLDTFAPHAAVVHADIDPAEIGKNRVADVPIVGDVREVLRRARPGRAGRVRRRPPRRPHRLVAAARPVARDLPARLRRARRRHAGPAVRDRAARRRSPARTRSTPPASGQHQMWAAQFISLREAAAPGSTPAALGTMGYAVPAAMGAKVGVPGRDGVGDRRRRLLPDDQPGAGHLRHRGHPDQGRRDQQRQPRHGAAVADAVLRRALLQHRSRHARPAPDARPARASPTS